MASKSTVSPELLRAARETYHLEFQFRDGLSGHALEAALSAALVAHEKAVLARVAAEAEAYAMSLEEDMPYEATGIKYFAHKLRDDIGEPDRDYEPQDDDVVEVTITGSVVRYATDTCDSCGHSDNHEWGVMDDVTGDEYMFRSTGPKRPRVRVLTRADQLSEEE